jgi:hypothetical protein
VDVRNAQIHRARLLPAAHRPIDVALSLVSYELLIGTAHHNSYI